MAHATKSSLAQSKGTSRGKGTNKETSAPKSNMKAGFGIFKDKIISKPSAWSADLRRTVKQWSTFLTRTFLSGSLLKTLS